MQIVHHPAPAANPADLMPEQAVASASPHHPQAHGSGLAKLALGAIGVVYGDIGTSPLYAVKECVALPHGVAPLAVNIYGVLSLIFWSITLVVSVKYLIFVMRADNDGEGGVLALMALVARPTAAAISADESGAHRASTRTTWSGLRRTKMLLIVLGLFGAALLYGDGVITPAISVLSAVEGLGVATSAFSPFVVPITCAILVVLLAMREPAPGGIAVVLGAVAVVLFIAVPGVGLPCVVRHPVFQLPMNQVCGA